MGLLIIGVVILLVILLAILSTEQGRAIAGLVILVAGLIAFPIGTIIVIVVLLITKA